MGATLSASAAWRSDPHSSDRQAKQENIFIDRCSCLRIKMIEIENDTSRSVRCEKEDDEQVGNLKKPFLESESGLIDQRDYHKV